MFLEKRDKILIYIVKNIIEILIVACTFLSIWLLAIKDYHNTTLIFIIIAMLIGILAYNYRKQYRRTIKSFGEIYKICVHFRETMVSDFISQLFVNSNRRDLFVAEQITCIVNEMAVLMERLVGETCVVSLMARDKDDNSLLKTLKNSWSRNAPQDRREGTHKFKIEIKKSFAGFAFESKRIKLSNDFKTDTHFDQTAEEDWETQYKSGFSAPVFVNNKVELILNIDCLKTNVFSKEMREIVQIGAEMIGLIMQISSTKQMSPNKIGE